MAQEDKLVAAGAELKLVSAGFGFSEGPAVNSHGEVYFTDQPNNRIWKYDLAGKLNLFKMPAGRANGMYFDQFDQLYACADEQNQLWKISPSGQVDTLVRDFNNLPLNGPNDVWVANSGILYFTDPYYQRNYWLRQSAQQPVEALYMRDLDGQVHRLEGDFMRPNGIVGSLDGRYLYVADRKANKTYRYTFDTEGVPRDRQFFVAYGSDGMTVDASGNVYLTDNGVQVFNPKGEQVAHIAVPTQTTNVCFAGKARDILFITAAQHVYTLKMNVRGILD